MSLTELARRAGLSQGYLSDVERGKRQPSPVVAAVLANVLDVTVGDLRAGTVCPRCGFLLDA